MSFLVIVCAMYASVISSMPVLQAEPFPLSRVRLLDGPFKENQDRNANWLLGLEPDRLLAGFRLEAGLESKAECYEGWERQGVAGHSLGHYLSACAMQYAATGDLRFKERTQYMVAELSACQDANGNGYVGAIPEGKRAFTEIRRGDIHAENFQLNGIWVPWYTLHKLLAGLRDVYQCTENSQALAVYQKLTDFVCEVVAGLEDEKMQSMLQCEHGGMNEAAADLYGITGEEKYLKLAQRFHHRGVLEPAMNGEDCLNGLHANTQFPKFIGLARQYELTGDASLGDGARFFWETVVQHHSYATGGNSDHEHFGRPDQLSERLSTETTETCNTYNMLKLTRKLFACAPRPEYAEYYERALLNHVLGSQDPETGRVSYFVPLKSGCEKTYQTLDETFSCCVGTGMENHTQYGAGVYFHKEDILWINLFIASELSWPEKGVVLRQETRFPEEDTARFIFTCEKPVELVVNMRRPLWAGEGAAWALNDEPISLEAPPGDFQSLKREWKSGDVLTVRWPMQLRTEPMPDNPDRLAIFYGPVLLAGALGNTECTPETLPVLITNNKPVAEWVKAAGAPLHFVTVGAGHPEDLPLIPFYQMHHQKHIVYWDIFTREAWEQRQAKYREEQERLRRLESRTLDYFQPGEMQPERDHAFAGENSRNGMHLDRKWRDAADGGWFAFTMKIRQTPRVELICTYWGSDAGPRTFDILADETVIATQTLNTLQSGEFVDIAYPIQEAVVQGKDHVRITFRAHPGNMAGGLFGCRMARMESGSGL